MIGYTELVNADPRAFAMAADKWDTLATALSNHTADYRDHVSGALADGSWSGAAADAGRQRAASVAQRLAGHERILRQVAATLRTSASSFAAAQNQVTAAGQVASRMGIVIRSDGVAVIDPTRLSADLTDLPIAMASVDLLNNHIRNAVRSADHADTQAAQALDRLTPAPGSTPAAGRPMVVFSPAAAFIGPIGGAADPYPPAGVDLTDPHAVKAWWDSLSVDQQEQIANDHPAEIGALDGMPCAVRDYANRVNLWNLQQQTQAKIDDLMAHQPTQNPDESDYSYNERMAQWATQVGDQQRMLDTLNKLNDRIGPAPLPGDGYNRDGFPVGDIPQPDQMNLHPGQKYLLGVDTQGAGHLIVAVNNPDLAQNVATIVPGVGSRLDANNVGYATDIPSNMVNGVNGKHGAPTSVIFWDNYDAPAMPPDPDAVSAASAARAQAGAPALGSFEQGLNATHQPGPPPHNVLIGHSYGSCVVGEASKLPGGLAGMHVNDVIAIGSPGMDVTNASDLGVDPGQPGSPGYPHVWVARDQNDIIKNFEEPVAHGTDPMDWTANGSATLFDPGQGPGNEVAAHGYYFDPTSPAMSNMENIIAGNYDQVTQPTWMSSNPGTHPYDG